MSAEAPEAGSLVKAGLFRSTHLPPAFPKSSFTSFSPFLRPLLCQLAQGCGRALAPYSWHTDMQAQ